MTLSNEAKLLIDFVKKWDGAELLSTGAQVVDFTGDLYNVDGSSDDPNIDGLSWKRLLIQNGINDDCYVSNITPTSSSSHPGFNVGGHMTVNSDGSVQVGGECYLMPLCSWHNSKARDGMAFTPSQTTMIILSGYMLGEPNATFMARQPNSNEFSVVPFRDNANELMDLSIQRKGNHQHLLLKHLTEEQQIKHFILFKKEKRDGEFYYMIEDAVLPE